MNKWKITKKDLLRNFIVYLLALKALSHGDAYAQQNIIANLFAQHVSEVEQNTQRVDGRVICRVIIQ